MGGKNKEQTKCKKRSYVTLHSLYICRLTLAWIFSEISTNYEECCLILTGLPSLLLDSISCRLVSSLSGVDLNCSTATQRLSSPTAFSGFLVLTLPRVALPTSGHVEDRGLRPLLGFVLKQTKGSSAWRTTYIVSQMIYLLADKINL